MNFFEQNLRKCTEGHDNAKFVGSALYIPLGENNRLKLQFVTLGYAEHYEGIRLTALDKNSGTIDSTTLKFKDIWGKKKINNPNFRDGLVPYAWVYNGVTEWYGYQPTPRDFELLSEQIDSYAELFMEQSYQQKEKMLSELYCGRLMPAEKSVVSGSEYQNSSSGLSSLKKKLKPC